MSKYFLFVEYITQFYINYSFIHVLLSDMKISSDADANR